MLSKPQLTILLTNAWLDERGGTESVIRDLAVGFLRRGHRPIVYSPHLGEPAEELKGHGVAVISDLAQLAESPDVIHGQHYIQTAEALFRFPEVPAIQMCHAWQFWIERPLKFPQIHRYVAVDQAVRDRLVHMEGIEPAKVEILPNAVDLLRYPARPAPLPERPARALAFTKTKAQIPMLQATCRRHGVRLDVLGRGGARTVAWPELELVNYDLVFATARMALEALCAGCAVIVCDSRGMAGLVTPDNFEALRQVNLGLRSLVYPVAEDRLVAELARYDRARAAEVSALARRTASIGDLLDRLEAMYREAIAADRPAPEASRRAELAFLTQTLPRTRLDHRWPWMLERQQLLARIEALERELARPLRD